MEKLRDIEKIISDYVALDERVRFLLQGSRDTVGFMNLFRTTLRQ
jgi:hypothetical protein